MSKRARPKGELLDELQSSQTKRARYQAKLATLSLVIQDLEADLGIGKITCTDCGSEAVERTSQSAKNPGRKYWSCPTPKHAWIGWVDQVKKPETREESSVIIPPVQTCVKCKQELSLDKELDIYSVAWEQGEEEPTREQVVSMFTTGDYMCASCVNAK